MNVSGMLFYCALLLLTILDKYLMKDESALTVRTLTLLSLSLSLYYFFTCSMSITPFLSGSAIIFPSGMFLPPLFHPSYPRYIYLYSEEAESIV